MTMRSKVIYKDGTSPVMLRVRAAGKVAEEQLLRVEPKFWLEDKGRVRATYPFSGDFNEIIQKRLHEVERNILEFTKQGRFVTPESVLAAKVSHENFIDYVASYITNITSGGNPHTKEKYLSHLTVLQQFCGATLRFDELDESLFRKFIAWEKNLGKSGNTIHRRFSFFSSVIKAAMREGLLKTDPLFFIEVKKVKSPKSKLVKAEIEAFEKIALPTDQNIHKARCAFLLQYYLRGARISDALMLRPENIVSGRIEYSSLKTGTFQSVRIHDRLSELLEHLLSYGRPYLLPFMTFKYDPAQGREENEIRMWRELESKESIINRQLKEIARRLGINKNITTHVARHTFARAVDKIEPDKRKVMGMVGHSRYSMTMEYLEEVRDDELDDSAEQVFK